jgi:hypothetical protein
MKITMGRLATVSLVALAGAAAATPAAAQKIENQYVCVFNPGLVSQGSVKAEANRSARAAGGNVKFTYERTIRGFAVNASAQGVANMQAKNPLSPIASRNRSTTSPLRLPVRASPAVVVTAAVPALPRPRLGASNALVAARPVRPDVRSSSTAVSISTTPTLT